MELNLGGRVAFITGATGGIGFAIANILGEEGCKLIICDLNESAINEKKKRIQEKNISVFSGAFDVTNEENYINFAEKAYKHFGRIDFWINNAGIQIHKSLSDFTLDQWDKILNVNITSVFLGCRIARKYLAKQGGVILNAGSIQGILPAAGSGPYAATKAAVISLTRTFAAEFAKDNIRVLCYNPSAVNTALLHDDKDVALQGDLYASLPCNRLAEPEDIANLVAFLCSDKASYINGVCVDITGGKFCVQNPRFAWEFENFANTRA